MNKVTDQINNGSISSDLPAGEGGVLSSGLRKIVVYRDYDDNLKAFSAVCHHLGCIVHWSTDEKSFDLSLSWFKIFYRRRRDQWFGTN
ncbi:hypothetical protein FLCH110379_10150 [Flavobacterium chungbukense]|uniref:Rieske domain-containing protein n=1 Tax=Flavobacterium chungbukense TaxID=877464 RepID=A0ABP7XLJ8_9FLAO